MAIALYACHKEPATTNNPPTPASTLNPTEINLSGGWKVTYQALLDTSGNIIPGTVVPYIDTNNCRLDLFTSYNTTVGNDYKDGYQGLGCIYSVTYWKATSTHLNLFGTFYYIRTLNSTVLELTFSNSPNTSLLHLER